MTTGFENSGEEPGVRATGSGRRGRALSWCHEKEHDAGPDAPARRHCAGGSLGGHPDLSDDRGLIPKSVVERPDDDGGAGPGPQLCTGVSVVDRERQVAVRVLHEHELPGIDIGEDLSVGDVEAMALEAHL